MKVKFKKEFIEKVKADPLHWRDPNFILSHEGKTISMKEVQVRINGYVYEGEDIEFIE